MLRVASTRSIPLCRFKPLEKNHHLDDDAADDGVHHDRMIMIASTKVSTDF